MSRVAGVDVTGKIATSINWLFPIARGLWDELAADDPVAMDFSSRSVGELAVEWEALIANDLKKWGVDITLPDGNVAADQAHRTIRSDGFGAFHADLQRVILLDTSAVW